MGLRPAVWQAGGIHVGIWAFGIGDVRRGGCYTLDSSYLTLMFFSRGSRFLCISNQELH